MENVREKIKTNKGLIWDVQCASNKITERENGREENSYIRGNREEFSQNEDTDLQSGMTDKWPHSEPEKTHPKNASNARAGAAVVQ